MKLSFALLLSLLSVSTPHAQVRTPAALDTLFARFNRGELPCGNAVDSFAVLQKANPTSALAALYLGHAYGSAGFVGSECCHTEREGLEFLDSEIAWDERSFHLDSTARTVGYRYSALEEIGHAYGSRMLWALYDRDLHRAQQEIATGLDKRGFSSGMLVLGVIALMGLDTNAILFTFGETGFLSSLSLQLLQNVRPDVTIINLPNLSMGWYQSLIAWGIGHRITPVPFPMFDSTSDTMRTFLTAEMRDVSRHGRIAPDTFRVSKTADRGWFDTTGAPVTTSAFRPILTNDTLGAEIFVRILQANEWKRPVYFFGTGHPELFRGIEPFERHDGLVTRLFPDTGYGYDTSTRMWVDSDNFAKAARIAMRARRKSPDSLADEFYSESLFEYLPGYVVKLDTNVYRAFMDSLRPLWRSSPRNLVSYYTSLAFQTGGAARPANADMIWICKTAENQLRRYPVHEGLFSLHLFYAKALAELSRCEELHSFVASIPPQADDVQRDIRSQIDQVHCEPMKGKKVRK